MSRLHFLPTLKIKSFVFSDESTNVQSKPVIQLILVLKWPGSAVVRSQIRLKTS